MDVMSGKLVACSCLQMDGSPSDGEHSAFCECQDMANSFVTKGLLKCGRDSQISG